MPRDQFEELVAAALDQVPTELADLMDNVVVTLVPALALCALGFWVGAR